MNGKIEIAHQPEMGDRLELILDPGVGPSLTVSLSEYEARELIEKILHVANVMARNKAAAKP